VNEKSITHGKYAELDGIRGLAILMVLAYHCGRFDSFATADKIINKGFEFGWVGVDLFFALSGYLITGILFDSRRKEGYLRVFFGRRVLRIFPLYFCFLIGLTIFAVWIAPSLADSQRFLHLEGWYWLYGVNFLVAVRGDWNAAPFDTGILWSLAIEEQFYLIWPFVVWKSSRTTLVKLCVALIACAGLFRVVLRWHGVSPPALYTLTPARMDVLLVGALAALLVRGPASREQLREYVRAALAAGVGLLSLAVIADRGVTGNGRMMQTLGFTGIALIAFSVILMTRTMPQGGRLRTVLRSRTLMFFGAYSYALYVLHYVVRNAVFQVFPPLESLPPAAGLLFPWAVLRGACAVGIAIALSLASWHLVERRCLALKRHFRYGANTTEFAKELASEAASVRG
jgi:peptidoglycan/LPS O-acetylase OafA/YrhL